MLFIESRMCRRIDMNNGTNCELMEAWSSIERRDSLGIQQGTQSRYHVIRGSTGRWD